MFWFIKKSHSHSNLIWNLNKVIPPYQFDQSYLCLKKSQVLTNTVAESGAETNKGIRMDSITFTLPSLRSKLVRVYKIFLAEMITPWLSRHHCALKNRNIFDIIIFAGNSEKHPISWPVVSCSFRLKPINVSELL
jgi:hypothetical protein